MSDLAPQFRQQFLDANGKPLAGGFLYTYEAGTTTPLATYTDSSGSTPNTNPIVLDSSGSASIWISAASYKFVLQDSSGDTIETIDNVSNPSSSAGVSSFNSLSGAVVLSAGSNITLTPSGNTITIASTGGGGGAAWGSITGTLSSQTDLNTALGLKAPAASPTFTGTITTPLSSGIVKSSSGGVLSDATAGTDYSAGTSALGTGILKSTTSTGALTIAVAADFPTLNQNTTGSAASFTGSLAGDVTGTQSSTTVGKINGTSLSGLATGLLKNTTSTGVPSIATAGTDYVVPSGNITGTAGNITATSNSTLTTLSSLSLPATQLSGTTLASSVVTSSLTTVGAIGTGTWNGTTIAVAHGGTGQTSNITSPTATTVSSWDSNKNMNGNNFIPLSQSVATAATTTTLTVSSPRYTTFTGSTTQTVVLPVVSTLALGTSFEIANNSTGVVTVQSSGANTIQAMAAGTIAIFESNATSGTSASVWNALYSAGTPTFSGLTTNGTIYSASSTTVASAGTGSVNQVFTSNGSGSAPSMQNPATGSYAHAYFAPGSQWTTTSTTFADPSNTGGNTLTVRKSAGITLTAAASSICGITFTPPNNTAVYMIWAQVACLNSTAANYAQLLLTDGTTTISSPGLIAQPGGNTADLVTVGGIYAPASSSAVTVKLQALTSNASYTTSISGQSVTGSNTVEWTVLRIF